MKTISLEVIKALGPCVEDYATVCKLYPDGVPLTLDTYDALVAAKVDVWWALPRLLDDEGRGEFVLYTLRYRRPHLVSLFRKAGLPDHADAVEACRFDTPEQAAEAQPVLTGAWKAANATANYAANYAAYDAVYDAARAAARSTAWSAYAAARSTAWSAYAAAWRHMRPTRREMAAWIIARLEECQ